MLRFKQFIKEASARPYASKGAVEVGDSINAFGRGAFNSATMDVGKYGRAAAEYGVKKLLGRDTSYQKELDQEKEKDTIAQEKNPTAYSAGGYAADAAALATGVGGVIKTAAKVGERQLVKQTAKLLARDQDLKSVAEKGGRGDIHKDVLDLFPDTPKGNKTLEKAISGPAKHKTWSVTQHMEKNPEFQQRVLDQLKKNDPSDKRINFLQDRKNVNDYLRKNYPDKFDDIRDQSKIYDPKTKDFRARTETDPLPGYKPNDAGENTITSAMQSRARLRPGAPDENPYLRDAVVKTRARTQPSFTNSWNDVPERTVVDKVVDKVIGAKYDKDGYYIGK